jgi:hypothetical protein
MQTTGSTLCLFLRSNLLPHLRLLHLSLLLHILHRRALPKLAQPLLLLPHLVEVIRAPQLRSTKHHMQYRREDAKRHCPAIPRPAPKVHDDNGFGNRAAERDDHGCEEDFAEVVVVSGVHAVEDDGDVGPEFCEDVEHAWGFGLVGGKDDEGKKGERTPPVAEYEFEGCVTLVFPVEADCDCCRGNGD